jgi:hypothetical protein
MRESRLGQTKEILCCSGGKVLGPGSVGRLENDNNSSATTATIMIFILSTSVAHPLSNHTKVLAGGLAFNSNLLIRDGVLYLDYHY